MLQMLFWYIGSMTIESVPYPLIGNWLMTLVFFWEGRISLWFPWIAKLYTLNGVTVSGHVKNCSCPIHCVKWWKGTRHALLLAIYCHPIKGTSWGPRHCIWTPNCPLKLSHYPALDPIIKGYMLVITKNLTPLVRSVWLFYNRIVFQKFEYSKSEFFSQSAGVGIVHFRPPDVPLIFPLLQ